MGHSFRDLIVWQKAKALAVEIYRLTSRFPPSERFEIVSQMRRAAVSVASNIAEGQGRMTKGEFRQFLGHARGSLYELQTQLEIARDLGYVDAPAYPAVEAHVTEVRRMLHGLCDSLSIKQSSAAED